MMIDYFTWAIGLVTSAISQGYGWVSDILGTVSPMGIGVLMIGVLFIALNRFILKPFLGGKSYGKIGKGSGDDD